MTFIHRNKGTCSTQVQFDIESGRLYNVSFTGGCNGNLQGISALLEGPDQLSKAIEEALETL